MKKTNILVITILIISMVLSACSQEKKVSEDIIKVGTSGGYKPYTFMNENEELDGFDVDIWKEIGNRVGKKVDFKTAEFSGLFGLIDTNQINTIANQITITEERLKKYLFTDSYVYYGAQLVVKKGDESIKSLEDLKGKKVGVSLGSNYEQMVREFDVNDEIEVITYENYQASLQDVSLGRIHTVLNDRLAGVKAIEESGLDLQLGGEPIEKLSNAFPFVKSSENEELIKEINKALLDMRQDGTLKEISMKWFNVDITEEF